MTINNNVHEIQKGKAVYILELSKSVQYWNNKFGAGVTKDGFPNDSHWMVDVSGFNGRIHEYSDKPFAEQLAEYLAGTLGYESDYLTITDDGRVSFNMIENADGEQVADGEDMGTQLYLSDYDCHITVSYEFTPNREQLEQLLPKAG